MRICETICGVVALAVSASFVNAREPEKLSLDVGGVTREAIVYAHTKKPKEGGAPLLFVFHGHGGKMESFARNVRYQELWPEALVVYPQGLNTPTRVDPEGKRPGWQRSSGDQKDRDLKLVDALLSAIEKKHPIDKRRVFATGFSNGAVFTYLLWAERPKVFAAFAPCAGMPLPPTAIKVPKPVFIVSGETDPLVKIDLVKPMIEKVRKVDGATGERKNGKDGVVEYTSEHGTPLKTLIHAGGHVVPREAPKLIVDFFREQPLK